MTGRTLPVLLAGVVACGDGGARQWAAATSASQGPPDGPYGADAAAGPPDALACADSPRAWAAPRWTTSFLEVTFTQEMRATGVVVYQTLEPGFLWRVEGRARGGEWGLLHEELPVPADACPAELWISWGASIATDALRLHFDTGTSGAAPQVDAVELLGER